MTGRWSAEALTDDDLNPPEPTRDLMCADSVVDVDQCKAADNSPPGISVGFGDVWD